LTAISDIIFPRADAQNANFALEQMSGESVAAAISQNFFVFSATTMVFSTGACAEKENTPR
jgi:hypothetical protein